MPRGKTAGYTEKQDRKVKHIAEGDKHHGIPAAGVEQRVWTAVNKDDGSGKKSGGSGSGKSISRPAVR